LPSQTRGVTFPLGDAQRALLAQVPESAESFVLVPAAAALETKLEANPISRDLLRRAGDKQPLPRAWMLGGACANDLTIGSARHLWRPGAPRR